MGGLLADQSVLLLLLVSIQTLVSCIYSNDSADKQCCDPHNSSRGRIPCSMVAMRIRHNPRLECRVDVCTCIAANVHLYALCCSSPLQHGMRQPAVQPAKRSACSVISESAPTSS